MERLKTMDTGNNEETNYLEKHIRKFLAGEQGVDKMIEMYCLNPDGATKTPEDIKELDQKKIKRIKQLGYAGDAKTQDLFVRCVDMLIFPPEKKRNRDKKEEGEVPPSDGPRNKSMSQDNGVGDGSKRVSAKKDADKEKDADKKKKKTRKISQLFEETELFLNLLRASHTLKAGADSQGETKAGADSQGEPKADADSQGKPKADADSQGKLSVFEKISGTEKDEGSFEGMWKKFNIL
jgi:hypothetical protein